jgi:hypothetical protein
MYLECIISRLNMAQIGTLAIDSPVIGSLALKPRPSVNKALNQEGKPIALSSTLSGQRRARLKFSPLSALPS